MNSRLRPTPWTRRCSGVFRHRATASSSSKKANETNFPSSLELSNRSIPWKPVRPGRSSRIAADSARYSSYRSGRCGSIQYSKIIAIMGKLRSGGCGMKTLGRRCFGGGRNVVTLIVALTRGCSGSVTSRVRRQDLGDSRFASYLYRPSRHCGRFAHCGRCGQAVVAFPLPPIPHRRSGSHSPHASTIEARGLFSKAGSRPDS